MINTNLPPILHRFRDIAVDRSEIAILCYPCCVYLPRRRGSPGTISGLGHIVLDGDPAPPTPAAPPHFRPMPIVAKLLLISTTTELLFAEFTDASMPLYRRCWHE